MNLPNKITLSRLLLTPIFVALAAVSTSDTPPALWTAPEETALLCWRIAYFIAIVAGATDFLDGYLARKFGLVTEFGKLMDPLSDKIYTMSCFLILTWHEHMPGWITVLILAREFAVTGLRTLAANRGEVIAARDIGKLKTVLQMFALAFGGLFWCQWLDTGGDAQLYNVVWPVTYYAIAALTAYSGFDYFARSRHLYMKDV